MSSEFAFSAVKIKGGVITSAEVLKTVKPNKRDDLIEQFLTKNNDFPNKNKITKPISPVVHTEHWPENPSSTFSAQNPLIASKIDFLWIFDVIFDILSFRSTF